MSKNRPKISDQEFDRQYARATRRAREAEAAELRAKSARYDSMTRRMNIDLTNGLSFQVPVTLLDEFAGARPRDIAAVELGPRGAALHWENLDLDFSVAGLLTTVLGTAVVMAEAGRKGGRARSPGKAAAVRANGAKGGRPRKAAIAGHRRVATG
jgi:hypothetical protein